MKTLAIIQARMTSTRFPGKVLADLCGKPVLQHVFERVLCARRVDKGVIAIPGLYSQIASAIESCEYRIGVHGGPESDVLRRFAEVAQEEDAEIIVRVCGDNPLIRPECIDALIEAIQEDPSDYAGYRMRDRTPAILTPTGYFAEVFTRDALLRAHRQVRPFGEDPNEDIHREHVTSVMYSWSYGYNLKWLELPEWYTEDTPNVSIDTPEDLERVAEIISRGEVAHASV